MKWREKPASHSKGKKATRRRKKKKTFVSMTVFASSNDCAWETSQLPRNIVRAIVFFSYSLSVAWFECPCVCVRLVQMQWDTIAKLLHKFKYMHCKLTHTHKPAQNINMDREYDWIDVDGCRKQRHESSSQLFD